MLESFEIPPPGEMFIYNGILEHNKKNFLKFAIKWEGRIQRCINIIPICIYLIFFFLEI